MSTAGWILAFCLGIVAIAAAALDAWSWLTRRFGIGLFVWAALVALAWVVGIVALGTVGRALGSAPEMAPVLALAVVPVVLALGGTIAVGLGVQNVLRERRALADLFPRGDSDRRVGTFPLDRDREISVAYEVRRGRLDGRGLVLRCKVAPEEIQVPPARALGRLGAVIDPGLAGRVWLADVPALVPRGGPIRVERGVVELRPAGWMTGERAAEWVTRLGAVVGALSASQQGAAARFATLATSSRGPAVRRQAWLDLEALEAPELAAIAPAALTDPDPVIRAVAAVAVGDAAVLEPLLRSSDAPDAVIRASRWALREKRQDLAPVLAGRLGTPPEEAWSELVMALGALGGRAEMEALHAVREGAGFPKPLRSAADQAMNAIRSRLGPAEAGRLALATGGEVGVAGEAGAVSVVGESGADVRAPAPASPRRGQ